MAVGNIFTDAEDLLIESLKSAFYYSNDISVTEIKKVLSNIDNERASELLQTALSQVEFEQKQRRDYVLSSLGVDPELVTIIDAKLFTSAVALYNGDVNKIRQFVLNSNITGFIIQSNEVGREILEQAVLYKNVADKLDFIYSTTLYRNRIKPLISALSKLKTEQIQPTIEQINDYIHRVEQLGDDFAIKNPNYSNAIEKLFETIGLSIASSKRNSVGQRVEFCGDVLLALGLLSQLTQSGERLDDDKMRRISGLWLLSTDGPPSAEEILET